MARYGFAARRPLAECDTKRRSCDAWDARIKRDAFDAIAEAAMDEGDGYFCPRQLEKSEILNVLEAISE